MEGARRRYGRLPSARRTRALARSNSPRVMGPRRPIRAGHAGRPIGGLPSASLNLKGAGSSRKPSSPSKKKPNHEEESSPSVTTRRPMSAWRAITRATSPLGICVVFGRRQAALLHGARPASLSRRQRKRCRSPRRETAAWAFAQPGWQSPRRAQAGPRP